MAIKEKISKEKFCKLVKCEENCWIFNGSNTNDFYIDDEDIIYFCNGVDTLWKFQDMPKYGEIWQSHKGLGECDSWTLWATWCTYS